jgi:hypothetical protein
MFKMFLPRLGVNHYVVYVNEGEQLQVWGQNSLHDSLENRRAVAQPKRHVPELPKTAMRVECHPLLRIFRHLELRKASERIKQR